MNTLIRTHVILPQDLLKAVDDYVGERKRSEFLADAASEKLKHIRLQTVAHAMAGTLKDNHVSDWETPGSTASWVRSLRKENDKK